ncbi:phosphodiester glycosidase family protein, partial [candidate division KSB1 bacterium]|nr:phosphodiester glycosidase family protein [candidate division KSB1 bacterium]
AAAKRCIFAMNALHTNFVRPNGFIVQDHQVIIKPAKYDALGLDCNQFMSLDGPYTAFVMDRGILKVDTLTFRHGELPNPPKFAISGPALIKSGKNVSLEIPFRPTPRDSAPYGVAGKPPFLKLPAGPTRCDEVNYPPPTTMTSFSAIGIAANNQLILLSMFEELRGQGNGCGLGITVYEMADLLRHPELNAMDAILSGGGADTQQFLKGDRPQFLTAPVRSRAPQQASRPEVEGPRGLGAILGVLIRP